MQRIMILILVQKEQSSKILKHIQTQQNKSLLRNIYIVCSRLHASLLQVSKYRNSIFHSCNFPHSSSLASLAKKSLQKKVHSVGIHAHIKLHQWREQIRDGKEREISEYAFNSHWSNKQTLFLIKETDWREKLNKITN